MNKENDFIFGIFKWVLNMYSNTRSPHLKLINIWCFVSKHRWFSGRMLACHAGGPGSIPGRCNSFSPLEIDLFQKEIVTS